ncbi:MAG: AAA family ATPase [Candidatus Shapirobacteria bacterium]
MKLFPSTLIISTKSELINQKIDEICQSLGHIFNENNPDLLKINFQTGFGIDVIRTLKKFLSQKAFSHQSKIIVIEEAHNLATEAQNALLKVLEEPGDNNYLIITTNKASSLLPTIISRCHTIKINSEKEISSAKFLTIDDELSKEEILPALEDQLKLYQAELIKNPDQKTVQTIEKIIKAIQMIKSNVDPKSALDYIFF